MRVWNVQFLVAENAEEIFGSQAEGTEQCHKNCATRGNGGTRTAIRTYAWTGTESLYLSLIRFLKT